MRVRSAPSADELALLAELHDRLMAHLQNGSPRARRPTESTQVGPALHPRPECPPGHIARPTSVAGQLSSNCDGYHPAASWTIGSIGPGGAEQKRRSGRASGSALGPQSGLNVWRLTRLQTRRSFPRPSARTLKGNVLSGWLGPPPARAERDRPDFQPSWKQARPYQRFRARGVLAQFD
jgi:hypothetical protein